MLDEQLRPWLLEVNTSPSLRPESDSSARADVDDLPIKRRVITDMLHLVDAIAEARPPPEAALSRLMRSNLRRADGAESDADADADGDVDGDANGDPSAVLSGGPDGRAADHRCHRRWRLGGCRFCPQWTEIGELWRASAEGRRAGGFRALSPSADPELVSLAAHAGSRVDGAAAAMANASAGRRGRGRPSPHELIAGWLAGAQPPGDACASSLEPLQQDLRAVGRPHRNNVLTEQCIAAKWDAMLCAPAPLAQDAQSEVQWL